MTFTRPARTIAIIVVLAVAIGVVLLVATKLSRSSTTSGSPAATEPRATKSVSSIDAQLSPEPSSDTLAAAETTDRLSAVTEMTERRHSADDVGSYAVNVFDEYGRAIKDAKVILQSRAQHQYQLNTDANGLARIEAPVVGLRQVYSIRVEKIGFATQESFPLLRSQNKPIIVDRDSAREWNAQFTLRPGGKVRITIDDPRSGPTTQSYLVQLNYAGNDPAGALGWDPHSAPSNMIATVTALVPSPGQLELPGLEYGHWSAKLLPFRDCDTSEHSITTVSAGSPPDAMLSLVPWPMERYASGVVVLPDDAIYEDGVALNYCLVFLGSNRQEMIYDDRHIYVLSKDTKSEYECAVMRVASRKKSKAFLMSVGHHDYTIIPEW